MPAGNRSSRTNASRALQTRAVGGLVLASAIAGALAYAAPHVVTGERSAPQEQDMRLVAACVGSDNAKSDAACHEILARPGSWASLPMGSDVLVTRLAQTAEKFNSWNDAADLWRIATETFPQNPTYHYRLGRVLAEGLGRREEAYGPLLRAVTADPTFADAQLRMGDVQRYMDRPEEAIASYQAAARGGADPDWALTGLSEALLATGKYAEALETLRTLGTDAADPDRAAYRRVLLANAQFWLGQGFPAEETLRVASRMKLSNWSEPQVQCALATVLRILRKEGEARLACDAVGEGAACGCRVWRTAPPKAEPQRFSDTDAQVAMEALRFSLARSDAARPLVIEEQTTLGFTSAPAYVRDAIAERVRSVSLGSPPPIGEALRNLVRVPLAEKLVWFPAGVTNMRVLSREALRQSVDHPRQPFDTQFAKTRGLAILSAPVYSSDGTAAAVAVQRIDRIDHPEGLFIVLQRAGSAWKPVRSIDAF